MRERPAPDARASRLRRLLACCALFVAGGCRFLSDEFTMLDRMAATAAVAPDAPPTGVAERP
ncbi:MAG: hypothetical protein IT455_21540 [Planctomycetes bacterium]|nr:hypothetical protein [Planctomycetota bacterium]